jgi:WD40 repeat protein
MVIWYVQVRCLISHRHTPSYSIHPILLTGGGDDKAFVWNIDNGDVKFAIEGHTDTVFDCGFSPDGKYVATGNP